MTLHERLHLSECRCVAVCGSGGKTSLCCNLSREDLSIGLKPCFTTTTHISSDIPSGFLLASSDNVESWNLMLNKGIVPVCGNPIGNGKLGYVGDESFSTILTFFDRVYVEADGSRMKPIKYPNNTEPVLPDITDTILAVCGLSALYQPLDEVCQRIMIARDEIPELGDTADQETIARLLWFGYGKYDPVFVINQADNRELYESGKQIAHYLQEYGAKYTAVVSMKYPDLIFDIAEEI